MPHQNQYRKWKTAGHILFWLGSIGFALWVFDVVSEHRLQPNFDLISKALILNAGFAIGVYANFYLFIPLFLKQRKYSFYLFWLVATLAVTSLLTTAVLSMIEHRDLTRQLFSTNFITSAGYIILTSLAKFITDWIELQDIELRYHKAEGQRLEAELKALKAQINPHFLFNSLNNIYALSLSGSDKTPRLILKLSDLMRHVLYESREDFIPLKKEVDFVMNFVDLQRIRLNEHIEIDFRVEGTIPDRKIMPLVFEPFLDNAFKHGPRTSGDDAYIRIKLTIEPEAVDFEVANSCRLQHQTKKHKSASGVGLENVKQRLALLYTPADFDLNIDQSNVEFKVKLKLKLK